MGEIENEVIKKDLSQKEKMSEGIRHEILGFNEVNKVEDDPNKLSKEIDIIINSLLDEEISSEKLGGLIALRGFIYQYYIAIYHMLNMLEEGEWKSLIYEYIDDIALLGEDKIRFIQVKTEREDGSTHSLTQSSITTRDKKLDSWLDKLFLNKYELEQNEKFKGIVSTGKNQFSYEFELATNMTYDSGGILAYYNDLVGDKHEKDKLEETISKTFKNNKEKIEYNFTDYISDGVGWCLERFRIKHYGRTEKVWFDIVNKIMNLIKDNDFELAKRIFQKILINVLQRTHNDNLEEKDNKKLLIFSSSEIRLWIEEFEKDARNALDEKRQFKLLAAEFDSCFEELHSQIESTWVNPWKNRLIETLLWVKASLYKRKDSDPHVFERFVNRLFFLTNERKISIDVKKRLNSIYLLNSIRNIVYFMTFYEERYFLLDLDTNFILKNGWNEGANKQLFSIYNTREEETIIVCRELIEQSIERCSLLSTTKEDVCFFVVDSKEGIKTNRFVKKKVSSGAEYPKVTNKYSNVKLIDSEFIGKFLNEVNEALKDDMVSYEQVLDSWLEDLKEKIKKG
ncbi:dsDNA nuclease domain-containing protein [Priestia sp. D3YE.R1]|uniref:dsDNA nuclease domain-containing protein n=1 Tax=Priestia sp. D3YE.R1 TaxID=3400416 RepID=UPI003BA21526